MMSNGDKDHWISRIEEREHKRWDHTNEMFMQLQSNMKVLQNQQSTLMDKFERLCSRLDNKDEDIKDAIEMHTENCPARRGFKKGLSYFKKHPIEATSAGGGLAALVYIVSEVIKVII